MEMTAEEIKQFWRGFCQRRKISADLVARGEAIIDKDPDYWADQTMMKLLWNQLSELPPGLGCPRVNAAPMFRSPSSAMLSAKSSIP